MRTLILILYLSFNCVVSAQTRLIANPDTSNCCYTFDFALFSNDQPINTLEIRVPPNAQWTSYQIDLAGGWRIFPINGENGFQIFRVDANNNALNFPSDASEFLSICFESTDFSDGALLAVEWRENTQIRVRESVLLSCGECVQLLDTEVSCLDSGGYQIGFSFINNSSYPMDEVRLAELGNQGALAETSILLDQLLLPGDTSSVITIILGPAAEQLDNFCFYLTGSRMEGQLRLDCCTALRCIDLPVCDRCCTDFESFEADVMAGFDAEYVNSGPTNSCDDLRLRLSARALSDCDVVRYALRRISGTGGTLTVPAIGRDTVQFGPGLMPGEYEVCMRVIRENLDGETCFQDGEIEICDTLIVDCISSLSYLNAEAHYKIFPNPVGQTLFIEGDQNQIAANIEMLELYNLMGQKVIESSVAATSLNHQLQLGDLPNGVYLLIIRDRSGKYYQSKVVVE